MEKIFSQGNIVHAIEPLIEKTIKTSLKIRYFKGCENSSFGFNDRDFSNCLRIQGIKENVNKSKNENSLAAKKAINKIFEELEVKAEIVNLHRLGSFENFKSSPNKPRVTFAISKRFGMLDYSC